MIMDDAQSSGIIDDETPTTRRFTSDNLVPRWGQNKLDRDREPFTQSEIGLAEKIGCKD
jgi:hypothetical protein